MKSLRECLETPFESLEEIVEGFTNLEETLYAAKDRRAVFATAYLTMTLEIAERVGDDQYNYPEWVAQYAVSFANLYRAAFLSYVNGDPDKTPAPWLISFETAESAKNLLMQDLLLGINAHINHDLALALDEVRIDPDRAGRREDHFAVNEAIRKATNSVQDRLGELYAPLFGILDRILGRFDERAASFSIEKARLNAWASAISLVSAESELEREAVRQSISDRASVFARLVLLPTRRSWVMKARQVLERLTSRWQLIRPGF